MARDVLKMWNFGQSDGALDSVNPDMESAPDRGTYYCTYQDRGNDGRLYTATQTYEYKSDALSYATGDSLRRASCESVEEYEKRAPRVTVALMGNEYLFHYKGKIRFFEDEQTAIDCNSNDLPIVRRKDRQTVYRAMRRAIARIYRMARAGNRYIDTDCIETKARLRYLRDLVDAPVQDTINLGILSAWCNNLLQAKSTYIDVWNLRGVTP